jgi:hypothetical protein
VHAAAGRFIITTSSLAAPLAQTRERAGAPAYLSSRPRCADAKPTLVSKDYGTGRQRWRVVKLVK